MTIFDSFPMPPAAALLGWTLIDSDAEAGLITVGFDGKPAFTNPLGHIQGGILSAMLDDTLGPALFLMTGGKRFGQTIDLHTHFLKPVPVGPITVKARVTRLGSKVAYMEGQLFNSLDDLAARATASALLSDFSG